MKYFSRDSFLFIVFLALLIFSPQENDSGFFLLVLIATVLAFLQFYIKKKAFFFNSTFFVLSFLTIINVTVSVDRYWSFKTVFPLFAGYVFFSYAFSFEGSDFKILSKKLVFLQPLISLLIFLSLLDKPRLMLVSIGVDSVSLVSLLLLLLPFSINNYMASRGKMELLVLAVGGVALLAGGVAGVVAFVVAFILLAFIKFSKRRDFAFAGMTLALFGFILFNIQYVGDFFELIHTKGNIFKSYFIAGSGAGTFQFSAPQIFAHEGPEKFLVAGLLRIIIEWGFFIIPLVFAFLVFYFQSAGKILKKNSATDRALYLSCTSFMLMAVFHFNLYSPFCVIPFFFFLGFFLKDYADKVVLTRWWKGVFAFIVLMVFVFNVRTFVASQCLLFSETLMNQENTAKSYYWAEKAYLIDKNNPKTVVFIAENQLKGNFSHSDSFARTKTMLNRAVMQSRKNSEMWILKGQTEYRAGNIASAYVSFSEAESLNPGSCTDAVKLLESVIEKQ